MITVKTVAILVDEGGEVLEVLSVKAMQDFDIEKLKEKARLNKAKIMARNEEKEKEHSNTLARIERIAYCVAKAQFNELVESGKAETTTEFEEMFDKFTSGATFNEEIAPVKYREILGRLR